MKSKEFSINLIILSLSLLCHCFQIKADLNKNLIELNDSLRTIHNHLTLDQSIFDQDHYAIALQKAIPPLSPVNFLIVPKVSIKNLKTMDFNNIENQQILIHIFQMLHKLWKQGASIAGNTGDFSVIIDDTSTMNNLQMQVTSPDKTWWTNIGTFKSPRETKGYDPFNDIVARKKDETKIIAEDQYVMAIQKQIPARTPVDFLIIPKKHIENLKFMDFNHQEDQQILIHMFQMLQKLWQQGASITGNTGDFSIQINNGPASAQTVFHLHMHVRSKDATW